MDVIWKKIRSILDNSKNMLCIYEETTENGQIECEKLNIPADSVLTSVVMNCSGICIDNWIRILGQGSEKRNGVLYYNTLIDDSCLDGMFIVANDVVGGIYAINISRFENEKSIVWYFAPDTLQWESLGMKYLDFIAWTACGNTSEFYETMRWNEWIMDCKNIEFDSGYLIYPFLWANECDINSANRKKVSFDELMKLNFDYYNKLSHIKYE